MKMTLGIKDKLFFFFASLYSFVVCFGNFLRIGDNEAALGIATIIIIAILFISPINAIRNIFIHRILLITLFLILISLVSAIMYPLGLKEPLRGSAQLFGYLALAGLSSSIYADKTGLKQIFNAISYGLLISSSISIIDYLKIYDFPYVNDSKILSHYGGVVAEQASGFFGRRSAMAAYFSLFIPMILISGIEQPGGFNKILAFISSGSATICLFLTHNRSGILGLLLTLMLYIMFNRNYNMAKKIKAGLIIFSLLAAIGVVISIVFPEHIDIYAEKLGLSDTRDNSRSAEDLSESDSSRIYFFKEAFKSMLSNPVGHGFALMYTKKYGYLDTHNIISHIIWATGLFGLIWLVLFYYHLHKIFKTRINNKNTEYFFTAIKYGTISWILNNMTHNNINMGITWLLLGLLISIANTEHTNTRATN